MEGCKLVFPTNEEENKEDLNKGGEMLIDLMCDLIDIKDGLGIMLQESVDRIVEDSYNIPEKIAESLIKTADDFVENRETVVILGLAAIGATLIIGKVVCKIPIPPIIEKGLVAPVIAVIIVRGLAMSAERRVSCG